MTDLFLAGFFLKRGVSALSPSVTDVMLLASVSKLLKSQCRTMFSELLLCCFWLSAVEPSKATYGSSHLLGAGLACDKWQ